MIVASYPHPIPTDFAPAMNANWFAAHVDLMLFIYAGIAIALVVITLWRVRKRKPKDAAENTGSAGGI